MSSNFSWFLRFVIYIPLVAFIIILGSYSYLNKKFDNNLEACLSIPSIVPSPTDRRKMVPFVGCLKKKSNFFLTKMMDENRLYQYTYPQVSCSFVGKWHVSEGASEHWQTINADASFSIEAIRYGKDPNSTQYPVRKGLWSAKDSNSVIQFFDDGFFWPINQGTVEWITANTFVLRNGFEQSFYFNRHSEPDATCVKKP